MSSITGPGKTAPKLIQDLLTYDPRHEQRAPRNLLTTLPPHYEPGSQPTAAVPFRNCRHKLMLKPEQSALPGEVPLAHGPVYRVASVCQECRWHVDIVVDVCDKGAKSTPCRQLTAWQLHHFVFQGEEKPKELQNGGHHPSSNLNVRRIFKFACSAPECPAQVLIHMRPPVFKDEYIDLLTSKTHLRNRLETAKQLGGDRDFTQVARPVDALDYLTTYLNDSLKPKQGKARVPVLNRMFMKTFGKDCDQVLKTLGFTSDVDEAADGSRVEVWNLPKPPPAGAYPDPADNPRTVVEDARQELAILIQALPETDRSSTRNSTVSLEPSLKMIERVLSCDDYLKRPTSGTRSVSHEEDHPYYSGLGAVGDFSDELLLFAYTAQWQADPVNGPYYFECLQDLAIGRKSTELEIQVQMLASKGHSNRKEVNNAYLYLAMDPRHAHVLGDEHIIGQFRARLQDIGPGAVQETRNMLRIIASARNSERIRQEASSAIETYSQALNCLDAQEETDDDVIITCYSLKASDSAASQEIAAKAVAIIAEHRNSQRLRQYLKTGDAGVKIGMDIGEAYAVLNISDRTERLDPETLRMQVDSLSLDMPQEKAKYEEAYAMVTQDQQNNNKTSKNAEVRPARSNHPLDSWPVGCFNIGNTCYLNSVLQFLFTIVPLREMVLECERYLQEITPEVLERKRVGRTAIDMEKAERAQQFIRELRGLFQRMIHANTDSIRPETRLAALALYRPDLAASQTDQDGTDQSGPSKGNSTSTKGLIPELESALEVTSKDTTASTPMTITDSVMGNDITSRSDTSSTVAEIDTDNDHRMDLVEPDQAEKNPAISKPELPSRPPPVPPRHQNLKQIEFYALQQDAAEVLNNVFDLLSCAVRGEGTMEDGEQDDLIKRLFFFEVTTVFKSDTQTQTQSKTELQDHYLISTNNRDRPLYSALDDGFSLDTIEGGSLLKFEYIKRAAPIQIINVKRAMWLSGKTVKDKSKIGLEDVIYLDRYLQETKSLSQEALQELRQQQWQLRKNLKSLERRKKDLLETEMKMDLSTAVEETASLIELIDKDNGDKLIEVDENPLPSFPGLADQLRQRKKELEQEAEALDSNMMELDQKINNIFKERQDHPYHLHAVFMHRGDAGGGHYWIYIYDFQNKVWRNYNDERVEEAQMQQVFYPEGNATSTSVVYVRADQILELTEAVNRNPDPLPVSDDEVEMQDLNNDEFAGLEVIDGIPPSAFDILLDKNATFEQLKQATILLSVG